MPWHINKNAAHLDGLSFKDSGAVGVKPTPSLMVGTFSFEFNMIGKPRGPITPAGFEELKKFVERLMGPHLWIQLRKYENSRRTGCDKFVPHRLAYLYDRIVESLETLKNEKPKADIVAFIELSFFQSLVESFKTGKAWKDVAQELNDKGSFVHMITMLAFLKLQRMRGATAKIVAAKNQAAKSADAVLYTPLFDRIDVEVKSPELLWAPKELSEDQAQRVIKNSWKKAKGQIGSRPSVLVIGGIYIPKAALAELEKAANEFLDRKKNTQVGLVMIMSVTALVDNPVLDEGTFGVNSKTSVAPQVVTHPVKNPYYQGIVDFIGSDREVPGLSIHDGNSREMRLGDG